MAKEVATLEKLRELDKRVDDARILQGNLEVISKIQERFQNSWGIVHASAPQWEEFKKHYVAKRV